MKELRKAALQAVQIAADSSQFGHTAQTTFLPPGEIEALVALASLKADEGESLHMGVHEPSAMPLYGGVVETLLPGRCCAGDEVMRMLLDGEEMGDELTPETFRLLEIGVTTDGLTVKYGRPYICGKPTHGRMAAYVKHLAFAELGNDEKRVFTAEVRDVDGDAKRIISVDLREQAIGVTDLFARRCVITSRVVHA